LIVGDPTGTTDPSAAVTWGDPNFKGITWDDIPVTTKSDAVVIEAALSSQTAVDMDMELRTADGQIIMRSAGSTPNEFVSTSVQPNTTYIIRVLGYANAVATYNVAVTELLPQGSPNANGGTRTVGGTGIGSSATTKPVAGLLRFTVNSLTKQVTVVILN
jgi:hypothetical protein